MASFRLATTDDPRDGRTHMVLGSMHYLNVYDDSGWRFSDESQTGPTVLKQIHYFADTSVFID